MMNDYIETRVDINPCDETATDLVAYYLCEIGYESFVPDESGVTAYLPSRLEVSPEAIREAVNEALGDSYTYKITDNVIAGRDWNSEWEKHYFKPLVIADQCVIHSSFHTDYPTLRYDIVIDPKMAFGTGHHATTSLIVTHLLNAELEGRSVIDMGTGTGILSILAAMRGASPVTAIEIDPPAAENAADNVKLNHHPEIKVILGDVTALDAVAAADVFLANINRNVITADIGAYANHLKQGGTMLLSGFYSDDVAIVSAAAKAVGLEPAGVTERDRWACLELRKL